MDLIQLTPLQTLLRSLRMVSRAAPRELLQVAFFNLIRGAGPSLSLIFSKQVIDGVVAVLNSGQPPIQNGTELIVRQPQLFWAVVALIVTNIFVESISSIDTQIFSALRDRVQGYIEGEVIAKIATFNDIALFENPELLNIVQLTEKGIQRMRRLAFIVAAFLMGIFTLVPTVILAATISWWVPLVLVGFAIPAVVIDLRYWKRSWRVEESQATLSREKGIYVKLLKEENYAKEIRLFSLQNLLLQRWRDSFERLFAQTQKVRREGAIAVMCLSLLGGIASSIPYLYVILGVLQGRFTLGDIALYTGIIAQLKRSLYMLIANLGNVYDVTLATRPVFQLLDLQPQIVDPIDFQDFPLTGNGLQLQNLSFVYPGATQPTLKGIDFQVCPGEMVVLVGENGAGKTTLGKLLARLYDPTSGEIRWNGVDTKNIALDELRSRIAVVMQDYARFPAKVRENVGWGHMPQLENDRAIHHVLQEAGINQVILNLDRGLDTQLGKQLENGVDLSGGQWQRVAIARALMRLENAELVIFDEPTAALDPKHEQEIYEIFRTIARGRMAVVISHRLSLARIADRIVVLEHGQIIEEGTHDALMQIDGRYADMFTRQASSYL
ncbi:ABC transporter ATP-binding protein [filamentous cyanobacterium LEGE 11480]|uniref:ABC transporter ATP-binding protein n=1 Tax=Romeriopsis navalis LEGE 11480 TaxID=2777977 RepID=A0A928VVA6_9CYAN|nr:ABC transporter ATP-binding protein [Romeriopsis navalis LEGE 11480]